VQVIGTVTRFSKGLRVAGSGFGGIQALLSNPRCFQVSPKYPS